MRKKQKKFDNQHPNLQNFVGRFRDYNRNRHSNRN